MRWFKVHSQGSDVHIEALSLGLVGLSIAGPKSRELLAKVTATDVSTAAFPFMSIGEMDLGMYPALV